MAFTATLDGVPLATGTLQEVQAASAEAMTGLLAQDPEGVALSAQQARRDFQTGTVEATVASVGEWRCPVWVHGQRQTLTVSREG
jgi:hypothetical protein